MGTSRSNKSRREPSSGGPDEPEEVEFSFQDLHKGHHHISGRLSDLNSLQHRNPLIHWAAFIFALISLGIPLYWILLSHPTLPISWMWVDIGLSVFFGLEFLTRSGLRWNPASYIRSRFFDFVAVIPVLVLVYFQVPYLQIWAWIILVARFGRALDRVLGDGFWTRNLFGLLEGFEEEITDRVMLRIMDRVRTDLERVSFGKGIAESLERNKENLLRQVHEQHPHAGITGSLARISGLNSVLERAEEHTFDAVIEIMKSPEMDRAIREGMDSAFKTMEKEIRVKSWHQQLGIKRESQNKPKQAG